MKILITEIQLKKILVETSGGKEKTPKKGNKSLRKVITPKTREYWNPNNPNCIGCLTDNGRKKNIVNVKSGTESGSEIFLTSDSAPYYEKMVNRMNADGLFFKSVSGYRPYETQFNLVDWPKYEDSVKNVNISTYSDAKEFGIWKTKKDDAVAVPGTSNHGLGYAIDVDYRGPTDAQNWVRKNGEVYGWYWGEVKSEDWHFTFHKAPRFSNMPGPNDDLINLMDELQEDIEIANTAVENGGYPELKYYGYCKKIIKMDDKGFSLLGKSTLPTNVDSENIKDYCYNITRIHLQPIKQDNTNIGKLKSKRDEYRDKLFKDYDLKNMTKRELKKLVKKLKEDGREDLEFFIRPYIPTPLKDLYDIYIK